MFARSLAMEWISVINLLDAAICGTGNISADSILFLVNFRKSPPFCAVQSLDENRPRQRVYCFIFSSLFIPLSLRVGTISRNMFSAIPIRDLMSLLQLPSADFSEPSYLKCSTTSICTSSTI